MRSLLISSLVLLSACAATQEQVTSALGNKYEGQSIDNLIMEFGPPLNSFKMASGDTAYQWELANHTNLNANEYGGSANTLYCRVRAIAGPDSRVRSVSTEDASNAFGESLCAKRLKMSRAA